MGARVLIVDDDGNFRATARNVLASRGYKIAGEAESIAQARVAIRASRPDALLLDVHLPDGDGVSLAEELASTHRRLRVLLTSSDAAPASLRLIERCGAAGFVVKTELITTDLTPYLGQASVGKTQG